MKELDLQNNPNLVMPPKPQDRKQTAYYNIDFSLSHRVNALRSSKYPVIDERSNILIVLNKLHEKRLRAKEEGVH